MRFLRELNHESYRKINFRLLSVVQKKLMSGRIHGDYIIVRSLMRGISTVEMLETEKNRVNNIPDECDMDIPLEYK